MEFRLNAMRWREIFGKLTKVNDWPRGLSELERLENGRL